MFDWLFDTKIDEKILIEHAKTDENQFAKLYDTFADDVYRFIRRKVATDQEAEDIVSETFMAVAAGIKNYDTSRDQKFVTWLFSIANHKFLDRMRDVYKEQEIQLDDTNEPIYENTMLHNTHNTFIYDAVMKYIETLGEKQKSIYLLRYVDELSNKEIASIYNLDEKTVSSSISLVTKKIKTHIEALHLL